MNNQSFTRWTAGLDADSVAQALAAMGVLLGGMWRYDGSVEGIARRLTEIQDSAAGDAIVWRDAAALEEYPIEAASLAEGWRMFLRRKRNALRLHVAPFPDTDALHLAKMLSRPAVEADSVYISKELKSPNERWHWPLRVGFLPDAESRRVMEQVRAASTTHMWGEDLLTLVDIGPTEQRCDLLLLPHDLRRAVSHVLAQDVGLQASCLVVTGTPAAAAEMQVLLQVLEEQTGANAIALAGVEPPITGDWFVDGLMREISHDSPFDLALANAMRSHAEGAFHFLMANDEWLNNARLSTMATTLRAQLERAELAMETVELDYDLAVRLSLPSPSRPLHELWTVPESFRGETHEATTFAKFTRAIAPKLREVPEVPTERRLQAQVFPVVDEGETQPLRRFRNHSLHRIDLRIAPPDEDWIVAGERFPEELLQPSKTGHTLTLIVTEPLLSPDPQVQKIFLPPTGASTTAAFYLRTQSTQEVEARVTVLYRNRVLQTWTLAGGAETDIAFLPEVIINASLAGLDRQTSPAAALVLNHTRRGEPQILKIVDDDAELISTGNLQPNVDNIEDELKRCDWGSKDFRALNAPGTLKLLRFLAVHGSLLYRGIVKRQFVDARLASAPSIQLIAARPGVRLPVEYFYDRPSPDGDATLCPAAEKSLSAGKCGAACAARNQSSRYICPLGFWGVSRVLEWHNYRSQHARELKSHDYALQQEKLARRKQLPPFDRVVVGASDRAKAEVTTSMSTLLKALGKAGLKAVEAKNWKTWKSSIAAERPPVLLMIPHTDIDEELNVAKLEIGKDQWLRVDQIQEEYIRANQTQPIVLLLGCETGKQAVAFEDFVSILTECGAAVVVTTSTLVLGRQATILAAEFAAVMNKLYGQKGATFGQVMLTVRRNMLRKGYPMVLSVSAYGDADWRL